MTTPLGTLDVQARAARRVRRRPPARARPTSTVTLDLDGTGAAAIETGIGFYDHLLGSLAHHGLFDLEIAATGDLHVDEHHTVEDVALVLGCGVRRGARRPRGDPALRRQLGADGRVRSRPRSSTSAGGRTP